MQENSMLISVQISKRQDLKTISDVAAKLLEDIECHYCSILQNNQVREHRVTVSNQLTLYYLYFLTICKVKSRACLIRKNTWVQSFIIEPLQCNIYIYI